MPPSRIHQSPRPNKKVLINKKTFQLDAYCPPTFLFLPNCPTPGGRPSEGTWDQAARQEVTSYSPPSVDRQTHLKTLPSPKLRFLAVINFHFVLPQYKKVLHKKVVRPHG